MGTLFATCKTGSSELPLRFGSLSSHLKHTGSNPKFSLAAYMFSYCFFAGVGNCLPSWRNAARLRLMYVSSSDNVSLERGASGTCEVDILDLCAPSQHSEPSSRPNYFTRSLMGRTILRCTTDSEISCLLVKAPAWSQLVQRRRWWTRMCMN